MGLFVNNYFNIEDYHVSEKDKSSFEYLKNSVDYHISSLVREKKDIKKARDLYDGRRDREEFAYLESTFGIETPIAVKMTPIIKTRVDVLLGLLLDETFTWKATINDINTLTQIENLKKEEKVKRIMATIRGEVQSALLDEEGKNEKPSITDRYLKKLNEFLDGEFISEFEIAVQSLLEFFRQDNTIDLRQKIKQFFLDVILSGEGYYRTYVDNMGEDPKLEICKPENIFYSKRTDHQFLTSGHQPNVTAVVHRTYMKRSEILTRFGHLMNEEALEEIFGRSPGVDGGRRITDARTLDYVYYRNDHYDDPGLQHNQHNNSNLDTLPVYHVEWLANNWVEDDVDTDTRRNTELVDDITVSKIYRDRYGDKAGSGKAKKKRWRLDRYEGWRIGEDIYVSMGRSKNTPRSESHPWLTTLSYNGLAYNDRNGKPYSIALSLKDIQDSYDIIKFFRDNLIANAGVNGSRVNLAGIPKILGQDYMERLLKFLALRKQGIEVYDPTEEGAHLFQHYGEFNGSMNPQMIEALEIVLESLEREADIVTGINRFMYQATEERDAVANVRVGQQTVSLLTKDLYELVATSRKHMLTDLVNRAKITYKTGKRGSYIVGDRQILFQIRPQYFCFTDYNIHLVSDSKDNMKMERLNALLPELVGAGTMKPDILVEMAISESPTDILKKIRKSMDQMEEEQSQLGQLASELEQKDGELAELQKQLKEALQQVEKLSKEDRELAERELTLKERQHEDKLEIDRERVSVEKSMGISQVRKDHEIVRLEREQLYADNVRGNAREVKNNL